MSIIKKSKIADKLHKLQYKKEQSHIRRGISAIDDHELSYKERFQGNRNLRRSGVNIKLSLEQIAEIRKCAKSAKYFLNNYCYIINLDDGLIKFKTRDYQDTLINMFRSKKRVIVKFPRQSGKTITTAAYMAWELLFKKYSQIGILANKAITAKGILQKVRLIYESLPKWMQEGVITWNKSSVELENGSRVEAAATSSSAIRSMAISTLIIDECAFIDPGVWDEFFASVYPTVSSSKKSKIFLISTPKGMNHFYKFWNDSKNGNSDFTNFEISWDDVPGRGEKFKKEVIAEFGFEYWCQEFECEFLGSSGTLIDGKKLKIMSHNNPIEEKFNHKLKIYELPFKARDKIETDGSYVILFDTSEGTGNDYSTIQVFRVDEKPYKQVAVYRDNRVAIRNFPVVIEKVALLYNNALVIGENNTIGEAVLDDLVYDLEYENVFFDKKFGIQMNKLSKRLGNSNLKTNIEDNHFIIQDYDTIQELTTYTKVKNSYEADKNKNDDTVTPLVIFSYFLRNKIWIDDWMDQEKEKYSKTMMEALEEDLLPLGFISDGGIIRAINEEDLYETGEKTLFNEDLYKSF